jgi:hypothetical protein
MAAPRYRSSRGVVGRAFQGQAQRNNQPAVSESQRLAPLPDPGLSVEEMARQLADDPEFVEAFGHERRSPWGPAVPPARKW